MKQRKSPRLAYFDYTSPGAYFVTLVCYQRKSLFGAIENDMLFMSPMGEIAHQAWSALPDRIASVELDHFTLMPNHLHGILWLKENSPISLLQMINLFKGGVTRQANTRVWQRSFYERVIRHDDELNLIRQYIINNPAKWALDRLYHD